MKILFIISASIAIKKCAEILEILSSKNISIDCIVTKNAKKMIEFWLRLRALTKKDKKMHFVCFLERMKIHKKE